MRLNDKADIYSAYMPFQGRIGTIMRKPRIAALMRHTVISALASCMLLCAPQYSPVRPPEDQGAPLDRQTSQQSIFDVASAQAMDPAIIYWDPLSPCAPPGNVGCYKPANYVPATPTVTVTSVSDSGAGTLRNALAAAAAGGVIGFAANLADSTIRLKTQLVISKRVTIDAMAAYGVTLDGGNKVRIFNINANMTAAFIGLRMTHGRAVGSQNSPGGAINTGNACNLTIRYCSFERDTADIGGAVRTGYQTITLIEDCTFAFNDGDGVHNGFSAGAVSTNGSGNIVVRRSLFVRNFGEVGAAIYNLLQPVTVEGCVFMGNQSVKGGAALFSDEGNAVGPSATRGGHITVRQCWMQDNVSNEVGGALFLWTSGLDTVTVDKCVFRNDTLRKANNVSQGGAVRTRGKLTISNSCFTGCLSQGQGGALWLDGDGPISIVNCTFYRNRVTDDQGGAMTLNTGAGVVVNILNCAFAENFSQRACGAFWFGDPALPITITNCIAVNNKAGSDHSQDQVGYQPIDGGGNIEFPAPASGARKVAQGSVVKDPLLDSLVNSNGMLILPLKSGTPAVGIALTAKAPALDGRGIARDAAPDAGAFEYVANDNTLARCKTASIHVIER